MTHKAKDNDSDISAQVRQTISSGFPWNWVSGEWLMRCRGDTMLQQHFEFSSQNIPLHLRLIELVTMLECMVQGMNAPPMTQWDQCASPQYNRKESSHCTGTYRFPMTILNLVCLSWFTLHRGETLKWSDMNIIWNTITKQVYITYHLWQCAAHHHCYSPPPRKLAAIWLTAAWARLSWQV